MSFYLPLFPKANEIFIGFLDIILQIYCGAVKKSATKPVDFLDMEVHGL